MKADNSFETTGHHRIIKVTGIPTKSPHEYSELTIQVNYKGEGDAFKGIALDTHIIPAIVAGINATDATPQAKPTPLERRMEILVNPDQTVTVTGCENAGLTGVLAAGLDTQVNALDVHELLAVRTAVRSMPFPLGNGERVYRLALETVLENQDKIPSALQLGHLRALVVKHAALGCNAPYDSYLQIAYDVKTGKTPIHSY